VHRDLTEEDIAKIAGTYHAWKSAAVGGAVVGVGAIHESPLPYADVAGFCKSVPLKEIQEQGYVLTPGRYVGAAELEEDDEPFEEKMRRLTKELETQFEANNKLQNVIKNNLRKLSNG
jgi:type I restriction enzyme M protein